MSAARRHSAPGGRGARGLAGVVWTLLSSPWALLCALCATALTLLDVTLIGRTTDIFIGGFLALEPRWTLFHFAAFVVASLDFDLALVLLIWLAVLPVLRRLRLGSLQRLALAGLLSVGPPLAGLYMRYQLFRFLRRPIDADPLICPG